MNFSDADLVPGEPSNISNSSPVSSTSSFTQRWPSPITPARRPLIFAATLVALWSLIYIPGLSSPPLLDDADSIHAEAAREMLLRHDFVTLYANGIRYLDKAPLPYWLNAASYAIFGPSEFSVRLPLFLAVLILILAVFRLGREIAGDEAGFFSALVLATSFGPYLYTRFFIPDIVVGLWLTISVHLFLRSLDQQRPSLLLCMSLGAVTGLNVLTKGLIGAVFPLVIFGMFLLWTRNLRHLLKMRPLATFAAFLAVAAPWHVRATLRNPPQGDSKGFFWFYFINEQVNRYLNKRIPHDYDRVPLFIFWGLLLLWLFPWSQFLISALRQLPVPWRRWRVHLDGEQRALLLLALWALAILVFFSFSTRQEYYVLPALPALALLCGIWLAREDASSADSRLRRLGRRSSIVLFSLGAFLFVITTGIILASPPMPPGVDFADLLKPHPGMYTLSLGHVFDLTLVAMTALRLPLALTGCSLLLGTALNWWFRRRSSSTKANFALAAMMVVLLFAVHLALQTFNPVLGSKAIALAVQREHRPGDVVVIDGEYSKASSVNFYTGIQLHPLNARINGLWYGSLFPDAPKIFEDDASFSDLWRGPKRVFFLTFNDQAVERLRGLRAPFYQITHSGDKSVFSNRPPLSRLEK
ncbi:MAG: glycosyltransferase family 39 protein [Acidobacteriota bacterium]|nr:glycosyltransferase family 39 protein [Acidobacteriota bacterium]